MEFDNASKKKKKSRKIIAFDEEIVTKDSATQFLSQIGTVSKREKALKDVDSPIIFNENNELEVKHETKVNVDSNLQKTKQTGKKNKRKKLSEVKEESLSDERGVENGVVESTTEGEGLRKKKKSNLIEKPEEPENYEISIEEPAVKQSGAIRAQEFDNASKKKKKSRKIIVFDEEIVTKDSATQFLSQIGTVSKREKALKDVEAPIIFNENNKLEVKHETKVNDDSNLQETKQTGKKNKRKKLCELKEESLSDEHGVENGVVESTTEGDGLRKKKKKKSNLIEKPEEPENDEISIEKPAVKQSESIRAQKRKKHAKLLEENRLKAELAAQHNALNYLSKWKHSRTEWKFEKLKQIWVQQNIFDPSKLPNEFWNIVVEYFSASKGFIRNLILRDALKIIEKEDNSEEENSDENYLLILQRARDIVQNLQE